MRSIRPGGKPLRPLPRLTDKTPKRIQPDLKAPHPPQPGLTNSPPENPDNQSVLQHCQHNLGIVSTPTEQLSNEIVGKINTYLATINTGGDDPLGLENSSQNLTYETLSKKDVQTLENKLIAELQKDESSRDLNNIQYALLSLYNACEDKKGYETSIRQTIRLLQNRDDNFKSLLNLNEKPELMVLKTQPAIEEFFKSLTLIVNKAPFLIELPANSTDETHKRQFDLAHNFFETSQNLNQNELNELQFTNENNMYSEGKIPLENDGKKYTCHPITLYKNTLPIKAQIIKAGGYGGRDKKLEKGVLAWVPELSNLYKTPYWFTKIPYPAQTLGKKLRCLQSKAILVLYKTNKILKVF